MILNPCYAKHLRVIGNRFNSDYQDLRFIGESCKERLAQSLGVVSWPLRRAKFSAVVPVPVSAKQLIP